VARRQRSLARTGLKISSASSEGATLHPRAWLLGSMMYVIHYSPSIFCHSTPGASATFAAQRRTAFIEAGNQLQRSASSQAVSQFFVPSPQLRSTHTLQPCRVSSDFEQQLRHSYLRMGFLTTRRQRRRCCHHCCRQYDHLQQHTTAASVRVMVRPSFWCARVKRELGLSGRDGGCIFVGQERTKVSSSSWIVPSCLNL
jgi:hypothetical protein